MKNQIAVFREDIEAAFAEIAAKHGVSVELDKRSKYSDTQIFFGATITSSESGTVVTAMEQTFRDKARIYGMQATDLNRELTINRKRFRITGLKPANRSYPIIAQDCVTGQSFKFTVAAVTRAMTDAA
jgi:plasmid stability protein